MTLGSRIAKLEGSLGATDMDRWARSLSDEELDQALADIHLELRQRLAAAGVECADMAIEEVLRVLATFEGENKK